MATICVPYAVRQNIRYRHPRCGRHAGQLRLGFALSRVEQNRIRSFGFVPPKLKGQCETCHHDSSSNDDENST